MRNPEFSTEIDLMETNFRVVPDRVCSGAMDEENE
jgi:hypothetical protein